MALRMRSNHEASSEGGSNWVAVFFVAAGVILTVSAASIAVERAPSGTKNSEGELTEPLLGRGVLGWSGASPPGGPTTAGVTAGGIPVVGEIDCSRPTTPPRESELAGGFATGVGPFRASCCSGRQFDTFTSPLQGKVAPPEMATSYVRALVQSPVAWRSGSIDKNGGRFSSPVQQPRRVFKRVKRTVNNHKTGDATR